jgi:pimeloyl-ACP methyl ester carboxylesterase
MLLIAGLASDLTIWPRALVESLVKSGLFVIRFDNRDVGLSTRVATPPPSVLRLALNLPRRDGYDLGDMAADTVSLLDHLGIGRVHLVGMSMGGMIAQTVAARWAQRTATLTSIFSTTGARRVGQPAWPSRLRFMLPAATTREKAVSRQLALMRSLAGTTMETDEGGVAAYASAAWDRGGHMNNAEGRARQINAIFASGDRTGELRTITAPTLVIHGDTDHMVHPSGGAATAAAISGARLVTITGMGHDLAPAALSPIVRAITEHVR